MQPSKIVLFLSAGLLLASAAPTAFDPRAVISARQLGMKQIGRSFKTINDQVRSGAPDAAIVNANARQLAGLAAKVPGWFPSGTGPGAGIKTNAKPEIWTRSANFRAEAAAFTAATRSLAAAAAKKSEPALLKPHIRRVGGACKSCHTAFQVQS